MNKKEVVNSLEMIAVYMEIQGENSFKVSAYRKAAQALERDARNLQKIDDVSKLKGIGKGTASVINELIDTGQSSMLKELKNEVPSGLVSLLKLPGLGGKKIAKLSEELDVVDIESLKKACDEQRVQQLPGFGKKTEEKIVAAIAEVGSRPERLPVAVMFSAADTLEPQLHKISGIKRFSRAGSLRRLRETVKDLDYIIATTNPQKVADALTQLEGVTEVVAKGDTKVTVELGEDVPISVDFRLVAPEAFFTALHHFTGSKDHNVKMRQLAKRRGEKISEYGIEVEDTGETLTFDSETAFYRHFDLSFIPPEVRAGDKEIEIFQKEKPDLISLEDIKGDLHMHSTWSDGGYSLEEMAEAARAKGYEYIAITDHSKALRVANGLTVQQLREQREEIDDLNEKYNDFTILAGIEMDILPDGRLDYEDELLEEMDFVIASIHSSFSQNKEKIMERLKTAVMNPHVDMIAHPTGRIIGRRRGYEVDVEQLIELAKETNTVLELNANPNRLDLSQKWLEKAQETGVKLAINTDAHYTKTLEHMTVGISAAKKGWIRPESVINTWGLAKLRDFLSDS